LGLTGENSEFLVVGLGTYSFIIYGVELKNQMDIREYAHECEITQIVSLSAGALKNKYFCTRDRKGHVKVWSSTNHPDCIFCLFNFDADEKALAHLQPVVEEVVEVVEVKRYKKQAEDEGYEEGDSQLDSDPGEEEVGEEEEEKPKGPVREVAPIIIGAPEASASDRMIEILWSGHHNPSTALMCVGCHIEK
jgi:WD40 repeat protein